MMKKVNKFVIFFLFLMISSIIFNNAYANNDSIVGNWQTKDDKTGKTNSIIKIYEENGTYSGIVYKTFPRDANDDPKICHSCQGRYKLKDIHGLKLIWGLKHVKPNLWDDGRIMDPTTDKIYRVSMSLQNDGNELRVHGYIGIHLFGRTVVWFRDK